MRYFYSKPEQYDAVYGKVYYCNHPVYDKCTLYSDELKGLAVIQQRYSPRSKTTWWSTIDPWLVDELYLHPGFEDYYLKHARRCKQGLYPTVTIRQIMWGLRMKPMKRQPWETVFDKCPI